MEYGNYTWNENRIEFVLTEDNNQTRTAKIEHFFNKLDAKNLGPERISNLVNAGLTTVCDILLATSEKLNNILGPTLGFNTYQEIHSESKIFHFLNSWL